jgi:hypothetical protein
MLKKIRNLLFPGSVSNDPGNVLFFPFPTLKEGLPMIHYPGVSILPPVIGLSDGGQGPAILAGAKTPMSNKPIRERIPIFFIFLKAFMTFFLHLLST